MDDLQLSQLASSGNLQNVILLIGAWFLKSALKISAKYYNAYKEDTIRSSLERQQGIALQEKTVEILQRIEIKMDAFGDKIDYNSRPLTSDQKIYPIAK